MASDERFRGPAGPMGPPGAAAGVDLDALTNSVVERLDPSTLIDLDALTNEIAFRLRDQLAADPVEQHIVVIVNRDSPGWPRLEEEITRAKHAYPAIRVDFHDGKPIGPLPQLCVLDSGVLLATYKGSHAVSQALSRLQREESLP